MRPLDVEDGMEFAEWTVKVAAYETRDGARICLCRCSCGRERTVAAGRLIAGKSLSCNHAARSAIISAVNAQIARGERRHGSTKHGGTSSPEWHSWRSMVERCRNPNRRDWKRYGGRGIKVCARWQGADGFANFLADMGPRGDGGSVERLENAIGYFPDNCRWRPRIDQAGNQDQNRLCNVSAILVRQLHARGARPRDLAAAFEVSKNVINGTLHGGRWSRAVVRLAAGVS